MSKTIVIWIDPNIYNEENSQYTKELEEIGSIRLRCFNKVRKAINHLKYIEFQEIKIILSGKIYIEFIKMFQQNILDMCVVPKISIFTINKEEFIQNNEEYKNIIDNPYYTFGGIKTTFEEIKQFITNEKREIKLTKTDENLFTFEYIDSKEKLALPLLYKSIIDTISKDNMEKYTESLYNQYSESNKEIKELLEAIESIPNIPIELLSKFYSRLYTSDSDFHKNINKDLCLNETNKHLPFIKILYEGVKLKALPLASNNILFRGAKIANTELEMLNNYLNEKNENLPGAIAFSKSFLSFSKDRRIAESFLEDENTNENLSKVLYILEKDDNLDFSLSTHGDIEKISFLPYEKEVLFLPFSSFDIKEIKETKKGIEKIYEIRLLYLGKYLKEIENDKELLDKETNLPDSKFKTQIIEFGLVDKKKIENSNMKNLCESYKIYKKEINEKHYEINLKYEGKGEIEKIFGLEFIEPNKHNLQININGTKSDLVEKYYLKKGENNIKITIKNKIMNLSHMFEGCKALINIEELKYLDTRKYTNFSSMFNGCAALSNIKPLKYWNVSNGIKFGAMFKGCLSLSYIKPLKKWNVSRGNDFYSMFNGCSSLSDIKPLEKWNVSDGIFFSCMFCGCYSLSDINPLKKWDVSKGTNFTEMFSGCSSLIDIKPLEKWNVSKGNFFNGMFRKCSKLSDIKSLEKWNVSKGHDFFGMFNKCSPSLSRKPLEKWKISKNNFNMLFK